MLIRNSQPEEFCPYGDLHHITIMHVHGNLVQP